MVPHIIDTRSATWSSPSKGSPRSSLPSRLIMLVLIIQVGLLFIHSGGDLKINFVGKRNLLEYEIQDWKIFLDNTGEMSKAEVKIVFRRFLQKIKTVGDDQSFQEY